MTRPVLVPAIGSLVELQAAVGKQWVPSFDGELTADRLASALDSAVAARTSDDLDASGPGYAVVLVLLVACGVAVLRSLRRPAVRTAVSPSAGRP